MINSQQAAMALYGAYRLARADKGGMQYFNKTVEGFWQSFYAAAVVAPVFLLFLLVRFSTGEIEVTFLRFISVEAIAYITGWVTFPLVMFYVTQAIDREDRYLEHIIAYNWAGVWQNLIYLPFLTLGELDILSGGATAFIGIILLNLVLLYTWFITKTALAVTGVLAVGIVVLDFFIGIVISGVMESMVRPG